MNDMQKRLSVHLPESWNKGIEQANASKNTLFSFAIQTDTHFSELSSAKACLKAFVI